ncbi:NADPH-dependent F420 reductase [Kribbella sp. NPDC051718]|uniref:NADPH-dependent F420 reductase n=1 Tax=Kribbella sp. NPDC051718 TaxID=3155168 RepID=UPI00343306C2
MKIGIIGSRNIGSALTRRFTALGHDVSVANSRGPESLRELAAETGATPVDVTEAAKGAELVVVTIPEGKITQLPSGLFDEAAEGVVVVDTGNYYPQRDGRIAGIEDEGLTESGWVAQQLGRPVVKAFNNIMALHLLEKGVPAGTPGRIALPVAGDDPQAKETVFRLIDDLGFDTVDTGSLTDSWRQQPGSPVYVADADADGVRKLLAEASPDRQDAFKG